MRKRAGLLLLMCSFVAGARGQSSQDILAKLGPRCTISREIALKTGTIWGSYYVLKEDVLGSLEPGKFADFLVLDRDYLTIPEEQIEEIRILMTAVGGKIVHLVPSLAKELGMQPTGAQVELGGPAAKY